MTPAGGEMTSLPWVLRLLLLACMTSSVFAEMAGDEYQSPGRLRSHLERTKIEHELEAARQREQQAERLTTQQQAEERMRLQQQMQQRPLGARLLDQRCSTCHSVALVQQADRGELGWRWTVERMRWWHGAELQAGEATVLAAFLARTQGTDEARRQENRWILGLGLMVNGLLAWMVGRWWYRNRRWS